VGSGPYSVCAAEAGGGASEAACAANGECGVAGGGGSVGSGPYKVGALETGGGLRELCGANGECGDVAAGGGAAAQVTAAGLGGGDRSRRGGPCATGGIAGCSETIGTCTMVLHCGHEARLPEALAGTFSARPQPLQWNSIESEVCGMEDIGGRMTNDQAPM
jgi:hypothetical protein